MDFQSSWRPFLLMGGTGSDDRGHGVYRVLSHPFRNHRHSIPHFVANFPLTYKAALLIIPPKGDMGNLYREIRIRKHMMPCPAAWCTCPRYAYDRALYLETLRRDRLYVSMLRPMLSINDRLNKRPWYIRFKKLCRAARNWRGCTNLHLPLRFSSTGSRRRRKALVPIPSRTNSPYDKHHPQLYLGGKKSIMLDTKQMH
jgi:hypothetical protein